MARFEKKPTAPFSPYYGCFIIFTAVLVFGGIITWTVYSLLSQDRQIGLFTVDDPVALPSVAVSAPDRAALDQKLAAFAAALKASQPATLALTVPEMNALLAMAPDTGHGGYGEMVRIRATDPQRNALVADVCLPMNRLKFWEGKKRYLIGEAAFALETGDEGVDAKVIDVKVPGKDVPIGFVGNLEGFGWVAPYRTVEPLGAILKAMKAQIVQRSRPRASAIDHEVPASGSSWRATPLRKEELRPPS